MIRTQQWDGHMPYQFDSDLPLPFRGHLLEGAQDIYRAAFNNALERGYSDDPRQEEIAHNRVWHGRRSSAAM
jgi:cation transport regulator